MHSDTHYLSWGASVLSIGYCAAYHGHSSSQNSLSDSASYITPQLCSKFTKFRQCAFSSCLISTFYKNCTHTHTHPFNGPFSGTTRVSQYQKGKTNLDFTEARDSEWQWHQLGHMQVCTSLHTDNHASNHCSVFYRPDALPVAQQQ